MLTVLSNGFTNASPTQLALSAALAVLFAALGYRTSVRYRALRGVTPWRVPSLAWALVCLVLTFVGLAVELVAELTTRSRYSPAAPAPPSGAGTGRYAPPTTQPVAVEPPSPGELPAVAVPLAPGRSEAAAGQAEGNRWPPPPPDQLGRAPLFGWYRDPAGRHERRYFDGRRWAEHVLDGDRLGRDPL